MELETELEIPVLIVILAELEQTWIVNLLFGLSTESNSFRISTLTME